MNTTKVFLFWKKNLEYFRKYCPTAYSPVISAKFALEQKVQNKCHFFYIYSEYQFLKS